MNTMRSLTKTIFTFLVILTVHYLKAQPVISSFSPGAGPVGNQVTITGSNFSTSTTSNFVYFGATRATVNTASANNLVVTVPKGANQQPITVTTSGKTAFSFKPYIPTFSGGGDISNNSFADPVSLTSDLHPNDLIVADLDGDGKSDLATANNYSTSGSPASISLFRNTSTPGKPVFTNKQDISTGVLTYAIAAGDLDGDGMIDLVSSSIADKTLSIFRNTGMQGNISFAAKSELTGSGSMYAIAIRDIDGDGLSDIVVVNALENTLAIYLNKSTGPGNISFANRISFNTGLLPNSVAIGDFDKDGKPDLVVANESDNTISLFRNKSTVGNLVMENRMDLNLGTAQSGSGVLVADLDEDGRLDIVTVIQSGINATTSLQLFRNTSNPGALNFIMQNTLPGGTNYAYHAATGDINGDGKLDLVMANTTNNQVQIFQNNSTSGSFNFSVAGQLYANSPYAINLSDLDNDGKPELISSFFSSDKVQVFPNNCGAPDILSFSPNTGVTGTKVLVNGKNFSAINAVSFGGIPAASFNITGPNSLEAIVGPGASGELKLTNNIGFDTLSTFIFQGPPVINSFSPDTGFMGTRVIIKGQNFIGVTAVRFGGVDALSFSLLDPYTIEAYTPSGVSGNVEVISPYGMGSKTGFVYFPVPVIQSFTPAEAPTGATVTIHGLNLTGTTSVSFGGVPAASFIVVDPNTVQAVVGNGATGNVKLSNSFGSNSASGFIYIPPPAVSSFSPASAPQDATIIITGKNFNNVSSVKFGGTEAISFRVVSSDTIEARTGSGSSGAVTVTTPGGSSSLDGFVFIWKPQVTDCTPHIGGPGTEVIITGLSLTNALQVMFGDSAARSFTVISDDSIMAVVGGGATGSVSVTTVAGKGSGSWFISSKAPVITEMSPRSGPIGSTITIKGANFQPGTASSIVRFGGVTASVLSATSNQIQVLVPPGATYQPVSVTCLSNGLTATSDFRFNVTFPGGDNAFNDSSFAGKLEYTLGNEPYDVKQGDIDGDGKLDLVVIHHSGKFYSIYLNRSSPGQLNFAPRIDYPLQDQLNSLNLADVDGDGKLDLLLSNDINGSANSNSLVWVYKNKSSTGNPKFEMASTLYGFLANIGAIETADINFDGKPDLLMLCTNCGLQNSGVFIAINNSSTGNISFESPRLSNFNFQNPVGISSGMTVTDFNGDGISDILVGLWSGSAVILMKNTTNQGGFATFNNSAIGDISTFNGYSSLTPQVANLASEKQTEVLASRFIYRMGNFGYNEVARTNSTAVSVVSDLNGDGKPEIIGSDFITNLINVARNTSNGSTVSFAPEYKLNQYGRKIISGDYDGDGKPEICYIDPAAKMLRILRNRVGEPMPAAPRINSFNPKSGTLNDIIGIKGQYFSQVTSVLIGGIPAQHFNIISDDSIVAIIGNGNSGNISLSNPGGEDSLGGFSFIPYQAPVINYFNPPVAYPGDLVTISGQNFIDISNVSFGGIDAESFTVESPTTIVAKPGAAGASGTVEVTNLYGKGSLGGFIYHQTPIITSFTPKTGPAGTWVTLKGRYLNEVVAAYFGDMAADSIILIDSTTIMVKAKTGNDGPIALAGITSGAVSEWFTFTKIPGIVSFSPQSGKKGSKIVITGTNLHNTQAVSFGGSPASSFTIDSYNQVTAVVGDGATGEVKVTNADGTAALNGFTFDAITAVGDIQSESERLLHVYPNPANDQITVKHPAAVKISHIQIIDATGRVVRQMDVPKMATKETMHLGELSAGIYQLVWVEENRILRKTIVVVR
ncbi:IPT/TIG domain-containing protein [Flavihumibacter profundi]|uniref:IPT/TIG domain-containing protein n=1 Tax=Flavihumibacter profundi TaxID=2716883 RepID=UPI001CC6FD65|nr:IPT/TIG domain-containing protein [Flavihumibacter profundi]MBZ5855479.1 IPT/TIG domain-containing protein [Flavihumibacter profundi]